MLPADRALQEMSAALRDAQRRIARLETLEFGGGGLVCLDLIDDIEPGSTSVTFNNINQTFLNLWLWAFVASTSAVIPITMKMTFNGDSAGNYHSISVIHTESDLGTEYQAIAQESYGILIGAAGPTGHFSGSEVNIYNYARRIGDARRSATFKAWDLLLASGEIGGAISAAHGGGKWNNTTANITSLTVTLAAGSFDVRSIFSLMGLCPS